MDIWDCYLVRGGGEIMAVNDNQPVRISLQEIVAQLVLIRLWEVCHEEKLFRLKRKINAKR